MIDAARATCDFYVDSAACADGVPYWDTGAPGLASLGDWASRAADPFNDREPVDSSAAAIAAQGLLRLGFFLNRQGADGARYWQAGLRVADTLFDAAGPYLSQDSGHQGLLLHSVYHWPNGWDHVPSGAHDAARRIEPVGGLSCTRAGALCETSRARPTVPRVLRAPDTCLITSTNGAMRTARRGERRSSPAARAASAWASPAHWPEADGICC